MSCLKYNTVSDDLFKHAVYCQTVFLSLNIADKFILIKSSSNITNRCAKACSDILDIRSMQNLLSSAYKHSYVHVFLQLLIMLYEYKNVLNL